MWYIIHHSLGNEGSDLCPDSSAQELLKWQAVKAQRTGALAFVLT